MELLKYLNLQIMEIIEKHLISSNLKLSAIIFFQKYNKFISIANKIKSCNNYVN